MAVFEPDQRAFEANAQLDAPDHHVDMDIPSHEAPLQNGHNLKDRLESPSSVNTSAHHINSDTQTSFEPSSDLPNSGETGDSLLPSSSQSIPDEGVDHLAMKFDEAPVKPTPAVVQQPTSDLRGETQPVSMEQIAEIKEQKQRQDLMHDPELANGVKSDVSQPAAATAGQPETEALLPTTVHEPQADLEAPSAPAEAQSLAEGKVTDSVFIEQPATMHIANLRNHPSVPLPAGAAAEAPVDPAPSPTIPPGTSTPTSKPETSNDQIMQDAPPSPAKVARVREDDDLEDGPAAKRSKIDEDTSSTSEFKVPERPAINTQVNGAHAGESAKESPPMTSLQYKALSRVMQNVKRVQSSAAFRLPVDFVALNIPNYPNTVTKPMDLKTLEDNLKGGKYLTVDAFVADFNQIVENCRLFNGSEHTVTKLAYDMKTSFAKQMEKVPGPDVVESSPAERKKKSIIPPPAKMSAPRRESRTSLPGAARSPVSTASTPTFALGPQGVPLIRRDSTLADGGRPKREIHPPAPRDLPYGNTKPKKKKYQYELKFCDKVLAELSKPKYAHITQPFMIPVDPVALNIPTYHSIIKKPMDFGTMRTKLDHGEYENAKEFEADARQVFQNCYKFNKPQDWITGIGHQLEGIFDSEWTKKSDWIDANTPASGAQSPGSSEAEDSDEEEEDDDDDEEQTQLSKLQQQIAQMSRQVELITQKKKSPPVSNKKAAKGPKPARKESKKAAPAKIEKKAASKPVKKPPYVTYEQKQDISNRINSLSETKMATALKIIRDSMPNLKGVQDDELELDIDELSDEVLHKLLGFVRKHVPRPDDSPARPPPPVSSAAPTRKKNKPMSKHEQEARIAQVQSGLSAFQNPGSAPGYDNPGPDQESSEGGESSESEEE